MVIYVKFSSGIKMGMEKIGILGLGIIVAIGYLVFGWKLKGKAWKPSDEPEYSAVKEKDIIEVRADIPPTDRKNYIENIAYSWVFSDTRQKYMSAEGWRYVDTKRLVTEKPKYIKHVTYMPRDVRRWGV